VNTCRETWSEDYAKDFPCVPAHDDLTSDGKTTRILKESNVNTHCGRFLRMKQYFLPLVVITLVLCVLIGGCTSKTPTVPPTTVPVTTTSQVPTPAETPACSLVPGPTQNVPEYESVDVTVERNSITADPTISTVFNGGQGLGMVQLMNVTVIRSDCITENDARDYPVMGETVTLMGTTKTDRVIVVMTMTSGDQYTIIDGLYPFPM
jgi:hypothetical protein